MSCNVCPRQCHIGRFCETPRDKFKINLWQSHLGEEPFLSGRHGSGTIFFSHCNLRCVFCQNHQISQEQLGDLYTEKEVIEIFYYLKNLGAHNINLVSPTPYLPQLIPLLKKIKQEKFPLPIIWNSNGYEESEPLKLLDGLVDIYLPDFKYSDDSLATQYSGAPNYFRTAQKAILEMRTQRPRNIFKKKIMEKGIVIRHLILPGQLKNSKKILAWLRNNLGTDIYLSLMSQYLPLYQAAAHPEINRKLSSTEYQEICDEACRLNFKNVFTQDLNSSSPDLIPKFKI
jgi:putative pyruvate formate lyase activating enzyme